MYPFFHYHFLFPFIEYINFISKEKQTTKNRKVSQHYVNTEDGKFSIIWLSGF